MRSLAVVALAASAAGACVEIEDIASYASHGTQYCGMSTWCKDVSCFGNAGTWARLGSAICKADSSDNLCGAPNFFNCGSYGINKATLDCSAYDCIPGDDDDNPRTSPDCSKPSSSSTPSSSSSGSSSQTSNNDDVVDDDKMMTLIVLAGLLGLSLAIAAGLALRQQQLAAKKPRAPRTFTVTAVQSV